MRYTAAEKQEIIRLVEGSDLPVRRTLAELGVHPSTFYRWYQRYEAEGAPALAPVPSSREQFWNRIPEPARQRVVEVALEEPALSPRELAWHITDREGWYISESSVYRILKSFDLLPSPAYVVMSADDRFQHPTQRVHELWQTDFTYLKVIGWGWYYLGTVLDDFSRYVIAWRLFTTMGTQDVTELLEEAIARTGVDQVPVCHRPRLLSDNGPCYGSKGLHEWMEENGMAHTRGKPYHPMTQGKIERLHRTLKNLIRLQHYYQPGELERELAKFMRWYNEERYHESLKNLTPQDVYLGRDRQILTARELLKLQTLWQRRCYNRGLAVRPEGLIRPVELRDGVH